MTYPLSPLARRIVLAVAVLGALVVAFGPYAPAVQAGETSSAAALVIAQADVSKTSKEAASAAKSAAKDAAKVANEAAKNAARAEAEAAAEPDESPNIIIDSHGIRVEEGGDGKKRKRVVVGLGGTDREYDSFEQFVHEAPGIASMIFGIVFVVLLTPVLIIALVIWYKLRKNRMLNETMLQLAEKGVVPPTEAMQALNAGQTAAAASAMAARAPLMEQAKALRTHAAWSDLRKGVILGAIGLALTFFSMLDDGTPNSVGLVFLFLGIGYAVLWYFEDRQLAAPASTPPPPPAGGA
jgi:Domain of unknown function (DUF6249)